MLLQRVTRLSEFDPVRSIIKFVVIAILAGFSTASSCADFDPVESNCVVDEECQGADDLCFQGVCTRSCVTDEDCVSGVCRSEARAESSDVVDVCVDDSTVNNIITMECRFDPDCEAAYPGRDARCGIDGVCFLPAFSLLIRDTSDPGSIADGGRGADIAAVYLADPSTGAPIAWADTLLLEQVNGSDTRMPPDGTSVMLNAEGTCTEAAYEEATTPLGGDGGFVLVRFLETGTGETTASPPSSWNVVVVEWGENCPGGELGEPDSFNVFACAAASHRATEPDRDCGELLARAPTGGYVSIVADEK